jgi:hypothetical protein
MKPAVAVRRHPLVAGALRSLSTILLTVPLTGVALEITRSPTSQTIFAGDPVTFSVEATGTVPLQYQWLRGGKPVEGATGSAWTFRTSPADQGASIAVEVVDAQARLTSPAARLDIDLGLPGAYRTNRLVDLNQVWTYRVDGNLPDPKWPVGVEDESSLEKGGGLLYVEEASLPATKTTPLPAQGGKLPLAAYFWTRFLFEVDNPYSLELQAHVVVDDGALVWLNGTEVLRLGMPEETVQPTTLASRGVGDAVWEGPFTWTPSALQVGTNLLTVEVHQSGASSSDLVWGMTLDAIWQERLRDTVRPKVVSVSPALGSVLSSAPRIELLFTEPVTGVTAAALLLNGIPATAVTEVAPDRYVFEFAVQSGILALAWTENPGITDRSANANLLDAESFSNPPNPGSPAVQLSLVSVGQSSDADATRGAGLAVDGKEVTSSRTADLAGSHWSGALRRPHPIQRIEGVNLAAPEEGMLEGQVLRLYQMDDQVVFEQVLTNPGPGATWVVELPPGVTARRVWIGLPGERTNGLGTRQVGLAEVRVFGTPDIPFGPPPPLVGTPVNKLVVSNNLASFKRSTVLRLDDSVAPAARANDDNAATETKTTQRTVDGYWEVDLGETFALYGVRAIGASGIGSRLTNAIVRLFDGQHDSVFSRRITGRPDTFDMDFGGPVFARYVRVGLEDKQRTDPAGGIEFYIGFREVAVFGRPMNEIGILRFEAEPPDGNPGRTLMWSVEEVRRLELHPGVGSVGAATGPDGRGRMEVRPTVSTEYLLVGTNSAGVFTRAVAVEVPGSGLPVRIDEVVADNRFSHKTPSGDSADWIELRNPGNEPVNLAGWSLSDDPAVPRKWTFPDWVLGPHQSKVVFASGGVGGLDASGALHVGFKLGKDGGVVLLVPPGPDAEVLQRVEYPALGNDLAFGRDLDGRWMYLDPTPDAPNVAATYEGWNRSPDWSHPRGFQDKPFQLLLTSPDPGAMILYSTNGAEPSLVYTDGIPVDRTVSIRARAIRSGTRPSPIQTRTFLFVDDVVASPVMNKTITQNPAYTNRLRSGLRALPTIALSLPGQPEYEEAPGSFELIWPDGRDPVQVNCGISRFGNAWTKFAKRSFRVKCRTRYGDDAIRVPLFDGFDHGRPPVRSFDELDLRSGSQDMSERGFYMAGRFVEDSMLDMGSLNPHGRYVHVYVNGVYWGQYDCRELLVESFMADYLGGRSSDYGVVRGNDNVTDDFVLGAPEPPNIDPWEQARAVRGTYDKIRSRVDVPHLIDFMLLWFYGDCESEFRSCGPLVPGTGFKFWIADADGFLRTSALGLNRTDRQGPGGIFGSLVREGNPDFKVLLADRIRRHCFNQGALTPAALEGRLNDRMREIADSLVAECARWNYRTPANWESAANAIRTQLFPKRTDQLIAQLKARGFYPTFDPPAFDVRGGVVAAGFRPQLSSAAGTIFYTLDGSDPRLPGGAISTVAREWRSDAVVVDQDLTLTVRVRSSAGVWSALDSVRFFLAAPRRPGPLDLLPAEIHYHPAGEPDLEFIELRNFSSDRLDLSRCSLAGGVRLPFPDGTVLRPGEALVAVRDPGSFAARFQDPASPVFHPGIQVLGPWSGSLDNSGERLAFAGPDGIELWAFQYGTDGFWPRQADGQGRSLVLEARPSTVVDGTQLKIFLGEGKNWTPSLREDGTPGWEEPFRAGFHMTAEGLRLEWPSVPGESYRVESMDLVTEPSWKPVGQPITSSSGTLGLTIAPGASSGTRFYRVIWVR